MIKTKLLLASLLTLPLCAIASNGADNRSVDYLTARYPWLNTRNGAALVRFSANDFSTARLLVEQKRGGFSNYGQGTPITLWGGEASSVMRVGERVVVSGSIAYESEDQKKASGSAWIDGSYRPFDIVEDSLNTSGDTHKDTYKLRGSIGVSLSKRVALGAKVGYDAANLAKYKDLRHKNKLMNLDATAGIYAAVTPRFNLGAHYTYGRETESLQFSMNGKTDRQYVSLISYGAFMGTTEAFSTTGFTGSSNENPLLEQSHGGGIIADYNLKNLTLVVEGEVSHQHGHYGRTSAYSIVYARHEGDKGGVKASALWQQGRNLHTFNAVARLQEQKNYMQSYRSVTAPNGSTRYEYYAPTMSGKRNWRSLAVEYKGFLGVENEVPLWSITASVAHNHRKTSAYLFPFVRRQTINSLTTTASVARHIALKKGFFDVKIFAEYKSGSGEMAQDGVLAVPSAGQTFPATMPAWLAEEHAWLTQSQYEMGAELRYGMSLPKAKMCPYIAFQASNRHACGLNVATMSSNLTHLRLSVGATF